MLKGLYISALGMQTQMNKMDVISNNLANVDTTGFKKDSTAQRSFSDELSLRINGEPTAIHPNLQRNSSAIGPFTAGVFVDEVYTDFMQGGLRSVGDPLTMAIEGGGFFMVNVALPSGEIVTRYTRDGNFTLNAQGMLVTKDGGMVLGQDEQPISIPLDGGEIAINGNGEIAIGGEVVSRLALIDFADYTALRKMGSNYYDITEQAEQVAFAGSVRQGFAEDSNINAVKEMVEMINTSRIYEANARFVQTMDTVLQKAVNEIARK